MDNRGVLILSDRRDRGGPEGGAVWMLAGGQRSGPSSFQFEKGVGGAIDFFWYSTVKASSFFPCPSVSDIFTSVSKNADFCIKPRQYLKQCRL